MQPKQRGPLGIADDDVLSETGRSSDDWYFLLDAWGAPQKGHAAIVEQLRDIYSLGEDWAGVLAIRYECARDLQAKTSTPADLIAALMIRPAERARYDALSYEEQWAAISWIENSPDRDERRRRIQTTVSELSGQ